MQVDQLADVALKQQARHGALGEDVAQRRGDRGDAAGDLHVVRVHGPRVALHDLGNLGEQTAEDIAVDLFGAALAEVDELQADPEAMRRQGGDADDTSGDVRPGDLTLEGHRQVELTRKVGVQIGQGDEDAAVRDVQDPPTAETADRANEGARHPREGAPISRTAVRLYVHAPILPKQSGREPIGRPGGPRGRAGSGRR